MPSGSGRSSLIGVAISLIGNILISLALNCQKLAHVRLEKESNESEQSQGHESGSSEENQALVEISGSSQGVHNYGTSQNVDHGKKINGAIQTHDEEGQGHQNENMSTTFLRSRLWWVGISLMTLGEFGNFLCECKVNAMMRVSDSCPFFVSVWICASFTRCSLGRSCTLV